MYHRSQIYTVFLQIVFSVQALYIYAHLMLESRTVEDFGVEYITNSILIFSFSFVFVLNGLFKAAEINILD